LYIRLNTFRIEVLSDSMPRTRRIRCDEMMLDDDYTVSMDLDSVYGSRTPHADCYIHYIGRKKCQYALVEIKGGKISDALKQLETTFKDLRSRGYKINELWIYMHGSLSRREAKRYVIENDMLFRKVGSKREAVRIDGIPVRVKRVVERGR